VRDSKGGRKEEKRAVPHSFCRRLLLDMACFPSVLFLRKIIDKLVSRLVSDVACFYLCFAVLAFHPTETVKERGDRRIIH
jgi:hypothetical protein